MPSWLQYKWIILIFILCLFTGSIIVFPSFYKALITFLYCALTDRTYLQAILTEYGAWGFILIVLLQIIQVVLFPLPGQASTIAAGYLSFSWGWMVGFLLSWFGLWIGSVLAFLLARYFLRDWVHRKLKSKKAWQKFGAVTTGSGLWIIGLIYALPLMPNDFMCYILGISRAPLHRFMLVVAVCRIPNVLVVVLFGYYAGIQNWVLVIVVGVIIVISLIMIALFRNQIQAWINKKYQEFEKRDHQKKTRSPYDGI
jgi:uncharacterized membrane protein YdjX (TVP38/TMEM64 family)